jgi:hypothetical protein
MTPFIQADVRIEREGETFVAYVDDEEIARDYYASDVLYAVRQVFEHRMRETYDI